MSDTGRKISLKAFVGDKKKLITAAVAAAVVLAAAGGISLCACTRIGSQSYFTGTKQLVLSSGDIDSIRGITRLSDPESIDLRGTSIPAEDIIDLYACFPACDIRWTVPLGGGTDSHSAEVVLGDGFTAGQAPLLGYMKNLQTIDARGLDYSAVEAAAKARPDCTVLWDVSVGGQRVDSLAESVTAAGASADEIRSLVNMSRLSYVDARGCTEYEALAETERLMPHCRFEWTVPIGGFEVANTAEELDFGRKTVTDIAALDKEFENLRYLPNLKTVDMCGCGVPSEQMAKWREQYPDVKFVWEIHFGDEHVSWTVRTDITVFSTLLGTVTKIGDEETFRELFLYCTDLVALDLGHNRVKDLSLITNLQKLQGLILTDNPVSDFSPLTQLPELQFLELNSTKLSDLTPFRDCKALRHLDINCTRVKDLSPLFDTNHIDYLIVADNYLEFEQKRELTRTNPDTKIAFTLQGSDKYIRQSPIRSSFRLAFKNYRLLEEFVSWDNVTYKEGAQLTYPRGYLDSWPEGFVTD